MSVTDYAVIFDMDGVIIDSNPFHKIALRQFCKKYGFLLSDEELRNRIYGRTNKEWITNLFGSLSTGELSSYAEEKESLFRELYQKDIKAVDGLKKFLKQLREANIPMAIGTSAPRSNVDYVLKATGIGDYFSVILDESHVIHGKPNPEIYQKVAKALKRPPANCIVFEDSLSGVEAAQKSGAKVVGITTTHSSSELSHCDFTCPDFKEIEPKELFERVFGQSS